MESCREHSVAGDGLANIPFVQECTKSPAASVEEVPEATLSVPELSSDRSQDVEEGKLAGLWQDVSSALFGIFQGLCCPMGLVGISFVASLPSAGIAVFMVTFLTVSAVGMGCFASAWATMMQSQMFSKFTSKLIYRVSCLFTFCLGTMWIIANYLGVLDKLNYAEHHSKSHPSLLQR